MKELVGQTFGQYRIEGSLGSGGMGQVFRGKHIFLDRLAAIKVMHNHLASNPTFRARFLQEAKSTAALKDPHIVEIYEFGEKDGQLYLVMELMTEGTLNTLLRQRVSERPISLITGLDLIRQAAEGLATAHERGMIHRDIKPDNLLLTRLSGSEQGGEQYELKISDFGLARLAENSGLTAGGPVGTPAYMSPEQCLEKKLDGRSDLYSLGVVLYETVTGSLPFQINNFSDAMHQHVNVRPQPLQQIRPDLPPIVEQIILRCLAKAPEERYQTGNELADALQEAINHAGLQTVAPLVLPPPISPLVSQSPRVRASDQGGQTIQVAEVTRQGIIVGRQNDCDIVLSSEAISRRHLEIKLDGKQVTVTDLKSSNGTKLDDEQLTPQVSQVWDAQQTISIGPFLLHLEVPALKEVIKPVSIPSMDDTKRILPERVQPYPYQPHITPVSNPNPYRPVYKQPTPEPASYKTWIEKWAFPAICALLIVSSVLILVLMFTPRSSPTPSAEPTVTLIPTPTIDPSSPAGILAHAKTGPLLLNDPLTTQNNIWSSSGQTCNFNSGYYQVTAPDKGSSTFCGEQLDTFDNFTYQVDMNILFGDVGGIIFRDDGQHHNTLFTVGTDKSCRITTNDGTQTIFSKSNLEAIHPGPNTTNTLTVIVINNNVDFYINGILVNSSSNIQIPSAGKIGVLAYVNASSSAPTTVKFTNAKVWAVAL